MIPKATEDTITSLLKEELERLGVKVELFPVINTPAGVRKPDLLCANAGMYPIEAKFSERDLIMAIAKVQNDYLKHHKVLGIKGGFAILYPEELAKPMPIEAVRDLALKSKFRLIAMFPPEDTRPFKVYEDVLQEIAKTLSEHVLISPKYVEPSIDYIIKSLRELAMYILNGLKHLAGHELEGFFGGKDVFKNILQYEEGKYPVEELKFAAAYLLVNQLLFYHTLSRLRLGFQEIDPDAIRQPSDLNQYFRKVFDINYKMVFSYDVASLVPPRFSDEVRTIINVIKGLSPEKVGGDLLGTIFHDLIPFEVRKKVAAFYTNVLAAELLASLSIDNSDAKVADFAVGSGGLLVAAYRRKKSLLNEPFTQDVHKRFVEKDLLGVDVMPFAANIAACHLALQSPEYFTNRVKVAVWDSTDLRPGKIIPSVAELKMVLTGQTFLDSFTTPKLEAKGVVSLSETKPEEIELETQDVIIMNPPFARQQRIPKEYKLRLFDRFNEYMQALHGQLGYYGYFILLADRFLKDENGRMALVLPATILNLKSTEGIRKLWSEKYHIEHIITSTMRAAFSESVEIREILLIARKGEVVPDAKTIITTIKKFPEHQKEVNEVAELVKSCEKDFEDDKLSLKIVNYSRLREDVTNWFQYIAISSTELTRLIEELLNNKKLCTYESLGVKIHPRDAPEVGGNFEKLCLNYPSEALEKSDIWIIEDVSDKKIKCKHQLFREIIGIPKDIIVKAFHRAAYKKALDVTQFFEYLIINNFENSDRFLQLSNVEVLWDKWQQYVKERTSNLCVTTRCRITAPGTIHLSYFSKIPTCWSRASVSVIHNLDEQDSKILCLWLNSSINLAQFLLMRKETEGAWIEVSKFMLEKLKVLDIRALSLAERQVLLQCFSKVANVDFPCLWKQIAMNITRESIHKNTEFNRQMA